VLAKQAHYHLNHTSSPFLLLLLEREIVLFCSGLPEPQSYYFRLPGIAGMIGVHHYTQLSVRMGVSPGRP
jgi:hypothetical protein